MQYIWAIVSFGSHVVSAHGDCGLSFLGALLWKAAMSTFPHGSSMLWPGSGILVLGTLLTSCYHLPSLPALLYGDRDFFPATDSPWLMSMRCLKTATIYSTCNVHCILDKLWDVVDSRTWQCPGSCAAVVTWACKEWRVDVWGTCTSYPEPQFTSLTVTLPFSPSLCILFQRQSSFTVKFSFFSFPVRKCKPVIHHTHYTGMHMYLHTHKVLRLFDTRSKGTVNHPVSLLPPRLLVALGPKFGSSSLS